MSGSPKEDGHTLTEATEAGDDLLMLKTLRYYLAQQIETAGDGRELAALSRQYADMTQKIIEMEKLRPKKERRTALDEARSKRKKAPAKRKARAPR